MTDHEPSVRFANSDESGPMRVYINNMNTRHATVTLPERTKGQILTGGPKAARSAREPRKTSLGQRSAKSRKDSGNDSHRSGRATGHLLGNSPVPQRTGPSSVENGRATSFDMNENHGSDMDRIYQRIMQRLQHELNYNNFNRISLSEQYRVDLDMKEVVENRGEENLNKGSSARGVTGNEGSNANTGRNNFKKISVASNNSGRDESNARSNAEVGRGQGRTSRSPQLQFERETVECRNDSPSLSSKKVSLVLHRNLPSTDIGVSQRSSTYEDVVSSRVTVSDAERSLALQPCPRPLQLVIQYVQKTLVEKMSLAETSSLENCLRFVFECRTLLDRLLREIPTYTSFPSAELIDTGKLPYVSRRRKDMLPANAAGSEAERSSPGGGVPSLRLQELFQRFNKKPVLLPRGRYVQDEETGAVSAELDRSQEEALQKAAMPGFESNSSLAVSLPPAQAQAPTPGAINSNNSPYMKAVYSRYLKKNRGPGTDLVEQSNSISGANSTFVSDNAVQLPASYGKSSRLRKNPDGVLSQQDSTWRPSRLGNSAATSRSELPQGDVSVATLMSAAALSRTSPSPHVAFFASPTPGSPVQSVETFAKQHLSVATMTELNDDTQFVPLAACKKLEAQIDALQLTLEASEHAAQGLAVKLQEESSYTARKAHIIQYLRETLIQECNMLRRQLAMPGRREGRQHPMLSSIRLHESGVCNAMASGGSTTAAAATATGFSGQDLASTHSTPMMAALLATPPGASLGSRSVPMGLSRASALLSLHGTNTGANANATPPLEESRAGRKGSPSESGKQVVSTGSVNYSSQLVARESGVNLNSNYEMAQSNPTTPPLAAAQDLASIQSLIDLALLAVESDKTMAISASELDKLKGIPGAFRTVGLEDDPKVRMEKMHAEFDAKYRRLRDSFLSERLMHNHIISVKDSEIARLRGLIDLRVMQNTLEGSIKELRKGTQKLRNHVVQELQTFRNMMEASVSSMLNFSKLLTQTQQDSEILEHSLNAMKYLVESSYALFQPMLTGEYKRGYHPWPLRLRNTQDPFAHVIKVQYGAPEVVRLRDPINTLNVLYVLIHRFVMMQLAIPDPSRPAFGRALHALCSGITLSWSASINLIIEVRLRYQNEIQYCHQMAKINVKIMWNIYLQNAYSERSVRAIVEGNMNPHTTTLPVAKRVNQLAAQRGVLAQERNAIYKDRMENARCVYRIWRDHHIDIVSSEIPIAKQPNLLPALVERDSKDVSVGSITSLSFGQNRDSTNSFEIKSFSSFPPLKNLCDNVKPTMQDLDDKATFSLSLTT